MLKKATFSFLSKLAKNNTTEWMNLNRDAYNECMGDFETLVNQLIAEIAKFDKDILASDLLAKDCIPRLNRDLRFAKDKSPYKTYLYSVINKDGRKSGNAVYYIVIEPGKSSFGAGAFQPEAKNLKKVHQEIDFNLREWNMIIADENLLSKFPDGIVSNKYLKKNPKDVEEDNPAIEFLKMKDFFVSRIVDNDFFTKDSNWKEIIDSYKSAKELNQFINSALEE